MSSQERKEAPAQSTADTNVASAGAGGAGAGSTAAMASAASLRAVVTGATGAIGEQLVGELLRRPHRWQRVTTVGRRALKVPPEFGIDQAAEEASGRLVQQYVHPAHSAPVTY